MRDERIKVPTMKVSELYREEVFTDRAVGTIRRMTPVLGDGSTDPARPLQFVGQAQLLTPGGALPISFEIDAKDLAEAVAKFSPSAQQAVQETLEEIAAMRREQASGLVIPDAGSLGGGLGGGLAGPGGGKLRLP